MLINIAHCVCFALGPGTGGTVLGPGTGGTVPGTGPGVPVGGKTHSLTNCKPTEHCPDQDYKLKRQAKLERQATITKPFLNFYSL